MRGVSDNGLIEITNLNLNVTFRIGKGSQIPQVAVAADPHGWSCRQLACSGLKPLVKFRRASSHIGVRIARHLQIAGP
jgi:hypothetical protein